MFFLSYRQNEIVNFAVKGAIYYVTMAKVIVFLGAYHSAKNSEILKEKSHSTAIFRKFHKRDERFPFLSVRSRKSTNCVPFRAYFFRFQSSACARKLIALRNIAALYRCSVFLARNHQP